MFGMGFSEILIIAIIAILFLGPDKLPQTMVDIARFFRSAKRTLASAKASIEEELHVDDIKREVNSYKDNLLEEKEKLSQASAFTELTDEFDAVIDMAGETTTVESPAPKKPKAEAAPDAKKPEVVTFSKKKKSTESTDEDNENA
ncbi:Sec-independent protein translocase protein TatB [Sulfurimonas diazotrophicus]|uniref:Sec-independent protein translocase protein TatB homolog n=1 Tax=Sulfurimonas diazotrophicus TaxID=3131939 RepID=A0ABZ3H6V4_9BACT